MIDNIALPEKNLIGALMINQDAYDDISDIVTADDFSYPLHRELFTTIASMIEKGMRIDPVTLSDHHQDLTGENMMAEIGSLALNVYSDRNAVHYAHLIHNHATEYRLQSAGQKIIEIAQGLGNTEEKLFSAQEAINSIAEEQVDDVVSMRELVMRHVDALQERLEQDGTIGLETGLSALDEHTGGLANGDLIIVAGRPSSGKTTFAMNIAENVAEKHNVLVFSLEMPKNALIDRSICSLGKIDSTRMRTGKLEDYEWERHSRAGFRLSEAKMFIDDKPSQHINQMRAKARKLNRKNKIELVVVDYIQLARGDGENQNIRVGNITAGLKAMAKELDCPVIALSQLSRDVDKRTNKRPVMSDLRDSGSIEQDADIIIFNYREEYYNPDTDRKGIAEAIIAKYRNGETTTLFFNFYGKYYRFESFEGQLPDDDYRPIKKSFGY